MRLVCFRRFVNFERKGSAPSKNSKRDLKVHQVVKFEDCIKVNQIFIDNRMAEVGVKNQYFAALTGQ